MSVIAMQALSPTSIALISSTMTDTRSQGHKVIRLQGHGAGRPGRGAARVTRTSPPWDIRLRATDLGDRRDLYHVDSPTCNIYARKKDWLHS